MNLDQLSKLKSVLEYFSKDVNVAISGDEFVVSGRVMSTPGASGPTASTTIPGYTTTTTEPKANGYQGISNVSEFETKRAEAFERLKAYAKNLEEAEKKQKAKKNNDEQEGWEKENELEKRVVEQVKKFAEALKSAKENSSLPEELKRNLKPGLYFVKL